MRDVAWLALVLAMVGVFGVLSYAVQQQVRDFGVRRALGASSGDVLKHVMGNAVRILTIGAAIGLLVSAVSARAIATMLSGVRPLDALTFAAVIAVVILTGAISVAAPAWRAVRIDPAKGLSS